MTRLKLPTTRPGIVHKVVITDTDDGQQHDFYIRIGLFPDGPKVGMPGEVFLTIGKEGSTLRGLLDVIGIETSYLMQHETDMIALCDRLRGVSFSPHGATDDPDIPTCTSIVDYFIHLLEHLFYRPGSASE